ncbi:superoxide dismutase family protein [Amorphus sp. 3PC139-8]
MSNTTAMALSLAGALALPLPVAAQTGSGNGPASSVPSATATFVDTDGNDIGSADLLQTADGVLIRAEVETLPAGSWVAFHIHETGTCDPESGFKSAGGHFNPTERKHGYLSENGPHAGDMPNQYVAQDGILRAEVLNPAVSLGQGDSNVMGLALVIHGGRDDYKSQPSGDAGDRVACAVIEGET